MKVVILAAGMGSRLGKKPLPKPLTPLVDGKPILEHQIEALGSVAPLDDVFLVVGYMKEKIIDLFPDLLYVYNPLFGATNTSKSLLMALNKIDDDVLWINGDVVFHPSILKEVLAHRRTSMVVNTGAVGEEEVKYRCDEKGKILEVSKRIEHPQGEALGINYCSRADLPLLRRSLGQCEDQDYFERGIELAIAEGLDIWSVVVGHGQCIEVDFPEDLARANAMLVTWGENTKTS